MCVYKSHLPRQGARRSALAYRVASAGTSLAIWLLTGGSGSIYSLSRSQTGVMKTRNSYYYYRPLSIWRDGQAMGCRELRS